MARADMGLVYIIESYRWEQTDKLALLVARDKVYL